MAEGCEINIGECWIVGAGGFEPPTSRTRTVRSTGLSHAPSSKRSIPRSEAWKTCELTGDEMDYYLFSRNGELENLILDYLGFPAEGKAIKGGGTFNREAWDWEYHEMLEGGLPATDVLARMKRDVAEARAITNS